MRRHWMAIPLSAITPLLIVAFVLSKTQDWSNGALGTVVLVLLGIAVVVGSLMAPKPLP